MLGEFDAMLFRGFVRNMLTLGGHSDGGNQFKAFAGFKDDKHGMFNQGPSQCHSIYYFI